MSFVVGAKSKVYAKSAEKYRGALHLKGVNKEKVEGFHRSESCGSILDTVKDETSTNKVRRSMSHKSMNDESFDRAFWEQVRGERKQQQCHSNSGSGASDCSSVGSAALKGNPNNHKQSLGGLSEVDETEIVPESMSQVLIDSSVWEIPIRHGVNDSMADKPIMLMSSPEKTLARRPSSAKRYSDSHLEVPLQIQRSKSLGDIGLDDEGDIQPKKVMGWPYIYQANKSYFAEKFSTRVLNDARSRFSTRNSPAPLEIRNASSPPNMPSQESIFGSPLTDDEGT